MGLLRAKQRCHQGFAAGAQLPYRQRLGRLLVVSLGHPVRFDGRLVQHDQMVAQTQALTAAKVGTALAGAVLFKHRIDAPFAQGAQQKICGVKRIAQQQVPALQRIEYRTQQRLFIAALALIAADGRIEHRPAAQTQHAHHPAQGEPQSGLLAARLWIGGLIGWRVRHHHRRAVHQPYRTTPPTPGLGRAAW